MYLFSEEKGQLSRLPPKRAAVFECYKEITISPAFLPRSQKPPSQCEPFLSVCKTKGSLGWAPLSPAARPGTPSGKTAAGPKRSCGAEPTLSASLEGTSNRNGQGLPDLSLHPGKRKTKTRTCAKKKAPPPPPPPKQDIPPKKKAPMRLRGHGGEPHLRQQLGRSVG